MLTFSFAVSLRAFESEPLWLAYTLDAPEVSSAGESREQALQKLQIALKDLLERMHPHQLWRATRKSNWELQSRPLPTVLVETQNWFDEEDSEASTPNNEDQRVWLEQERAVFRRPLIDGVVIEHAPSVLQTVTRSTQEKEEDTWRSFMRSMDQSNELAGPLAEQVELVQLEVEFEPLDMSMLPLEYIWQPVFEREMIEALERAQEGPSTPVLDAVAQCWSSYDDEQMQQAKIEPTFGRALEVHILRELVWGEQASPTVVVGRSRVGKTALVKHLVWDASHHLKSKRALWFAPPPSLCATDPFSPGWQQQCHKVCSELEETHDVLYIGRLIETLDAGKFMGSDYNLAQFLKPWLSDRRIRLVAEATPEEWELILRRDAGLARTFQVVRLEDPVDPKQTYRSIILPGAKRIATRFGIELDERAVRRGWMLLRRFGDDSSPIGATLNLITNLLMRAKNAYSTTVNEDDLIDLFCARTGFPSFMLRDEETLDLEEVAHALRQRVMGQESAIEQVSRVIGITKAGLSEPDRPLGSFLFIGPTGVGKTELARSIALFLFGHTDRLIRLDMSEYSGPDAYGRLIGEGARSGSEEMPVGDLTGPVKLYPFCVVLLDEIEKAHASVYDLLLQVLGEARLSDTYGRTTRFQNTLVIMTSNLGVESWKSTVGFGDSMAKENSSSVWATHFKREAERFFRPEFLARVDQFVPFAPLDVDVMTQIATQQVNAVVNRYGIKRSEVELELDVHHVATWIARQSWDTRYGARHLKAVISKKLALPVAHAMANHDPEKGKLHLAIESHAGSDTLDLRSSVLKPDQEDAPVTKRTLLTQIEQIASLRRRLQRRRQSDLFSELQWEVEQFDLFSQAEAFWQDSDAADFATRAEHARRLMVPFVEMMKELEDLEDLANESYHAKVFEIHEDIHARFQEIAPVARQFMLSLLRTAYSQPDQIALAIPLRQGSEAWRAQLIRWYEELSGVYDWQVNLYRSVPTSTRPQDPNGYYEEAWEQVSWKQLGSVQGAPWFLVEFLGRSCRPLLQGEQGVHRLIDVSQNALAEVMVLSEHGLQRPHPDELHVPSQLSMARVWNRRTGEVSIPYSTSMSFDPSSPWENLTSVMEETAWEWLENRWE